MRGRPSGLRDYFRLRERSVKKRVSRAHENASGKRGGGEEKKGGGVQHRGRVKSVQERGFYTGKTGNGNALREEQCEKNNEGE